MKAEDIKQKDAPVLRETAQSVPPEEITSESTKKIISDMRSALHDTDDGVAIAAPQIGASVRIFVVHGDAFKDRADIPNEDKIFINPEIVSTSSKKKLIDEGCLSVRYVYGKIERAAQATVRAFDESGNSFEIGAGGLLAQIFQHETDHLDGILFTDKAKELRKLTSEEIQKIHTPDNEEKQYE